jgi:hypothetical protein
MVVTDIPSLTNIAELIRHGQITVGVIQPMGCVAIASNAHQSLAMLVRRKGESLPQLLERLDLRTGRVHLQIYGHDLSQSQPAPTYVNTARRRRLRRKSGETRAIKDKPRQFMPPRPGRKI